MVGNVVGAAKSVGGTVISMLAAEYLLSKVFATAGGQSIVNRLGRIGTPLAVFGANELFLRKFLGQYLPAPVLGGVSLAAGMHVVAGLGRKFLPSGYLDADFTTL